MRQLQVQKGMLMPIDGGGSSVTFQFNPAEVNGPGAEAEYATIGVGGSEHPYMQYSHGKESVIEFELVAAREFDEGQVKQLHKDLLALTKPEKKGAGPGSPPRVMFILGSFIREKCIVKAVRPRFRRFHNPESLMPNEGRFQITLWKWKE